MLSNSFDADGIRAWMAAQRAAREAEKRRQQMEKQRELDALHEAFLAREVPEDALNLVEALVRRAAAEGEREVMVMRFPSAWMKDDGRSITSGQENWPEQLDGFAARAYEVYRRHLQPRGFAVRAVILDYPDGMPGDVGLFLSWKLEA